ncbi:hypothetical protein DDO07_13645 [Vibrio cholerae]|nr:hypothetical protein [Vibrio cholerae]EGR4173109.1 hypothetical protein [Vibrio cholerae]
MDVPFEFNRSNGSAKTVDCLVHNHSTTQISNGITNGFFVIFVAKMLVVFQIFSDQFQIFFM